MVRWFTWSKLSVNGGFVPGAEVAKRSWVIESPPGTARILYQGKLAPFKYLRVLVPLPETGINGDVKIRAVYCFSRPCQALTIAGLIEPISLLSTQT